MHQSVATIDSPEFINLQPLDINPLMSKCEIKVLYVGANRNHTFINQEVATEIGKTLRGAPIVGYYKNDKEDFSTHGERVIIDDEGVKFECQTVPYGFVSPDAPVWFQNFEDTDDFGNTIVHKYLMTTGYLWTEQFPESSLPVNQGRPQSMQLKEETVKGNWQTDPNSRMDFFIINDAVIQKICILGDDVEPCFEGASVTAPNVSTNFTLDDNFKHTLYSMMQDLRKALNEGGQQMENLENTAVEVEQEAPVTDFEATEEVVSETQTVEANDLEDTSVSVDFIKKDDEDKDQEEEKKEESNEGASEEESSDDNEDEKKTKKYALLEDELNALKDKYSMLETQYQELLAFKTEIDNQQKDALIGEFYMLSDEDKADVIAHKTEYSLDDIKAKLSVICFDKKINFALNNDAEEKKEDIVTYTINSDENNSLPDWVKAVKQQEKLG